MSAHAFSSHIFSLPLSWGIKQRDIKISFLGWGAYMLFLMVYCTLYKMVVMSGPADFLASLAWAVKQWAIWPLLTLAAFSFLRRVEDPCAWRLQLLRLGLGVILVSLVFRLVIDLFTEPASVGSSLVLSVPRYFAAFLAVCLIWYFWLRDKSAQTPTLPTPTEATAKTQVERLPARPLTLLVSRGSHECLVRVADVSGFSAAGNYVEVFAKGQVYLMRATMKQVEEQLPDEEFVRIHRSHIVRVTQVERIKGQASGNGTVHLRCGRELPISKRYRSQLQQYRLQAA